MGVSKLKLTMLREAEDRIAAGLESFHRVGLALRLVRDKRLFEPDDADFCAYVRRRWGLSKSRAYQLIFAAEAFVVLSMSHEVVPCNESQLRPLCTLSVHQQRATWAKAVELADGGQPTRPIVSRAMRLLGFVPVGVFGEDQSEAERLVEEENAAPAGVAFGGDQREAVRVIEGPEEIADALARMHGPSFLRRLIGELRLRIGQRLAS